MPCSLRAICHFTACFSEKKKTHTHSSPAIFPHGNSPPPCGTWRPGPSYGRTGHEVYSDAINVQEGVIVAWKKTHRIAIWVPLLDFRIRDAGWVEKNMVISPWILTSFNRLNIVISPTRIGIEPMNIGSCVLSNGKTMRKTIEFWGDPDTPKVPDFQTKPYVVIVWDGTWGNCHHLPSGKLTVRPWQSSGLED